MKKTIKQILSALLVAVMLVSVMPITSFAEDDEKTFGYLKYTVTDGWITITNCDTSISGELVVPETIESYPVKRINRCAFSGCFDLTSIIIPDSVTIIDNSAFRGCSSLTSITIPDSVTIIGDRAFSGCPLTSIKISDNVTSIGYQAFYNTAYYNDKLNWKNGVLYIGNHLIEAKDDINGSYTIRKGTVCIADYAFSFVGVKSITIPDSVTSIGFYAFDNCTGLTSITIPDSVTNIDVAAFSDCTGLESVTIGKGVKNIESYVFSGCSSLTSITIPDSVTSIEEGAFSGCIGLTSIVVDENNTVYDSRNNCNAIIETATNKLISGCKNTVIPNTVTSIDRWAFSGCAGLISITIPDSITSIGGYCFYGCTGLSSITIPDSVISIGSSAFDGCTSLTSITIPDSVTSIGDSAFYSCIQLKDVYYTGSEDEWKAITIEDGNDSLKNANIHFKKCEHSLKHEKSPATCTLDGAEYDICSRCGAKLNVKVIAASGHKWGEWITVTPSTVTASGTEKHICSVCKEEETRTVAKLTGLHDDKSGVELIYNNEFGAGTQLKVEQLFSDKSFRLINSAYGEVKTSIFDIETYKNGTKIQPDGEITVRIPLPAGYSNKVFVCYVDSTNGKVTKIPCEVKDGYVIFKTNHFSEYAIVEQSANVKSVSVSDIKLNYKKSATIKPTIKSDDGAKYTVKYSSSNTKVATVDENGKVYAAKKGSATITCTVTDSNGNTVQDTCKVTVKYSFGQWLIKILLFGWIWY